MKTCILVLGLTGIIYSCSKSKIVGPQVIPSSLFFIIKQNGNRLADSLLNPMKLYYIEGTSKKYISDFIRGTDEGYSLGVQTTRDIGNKSGDNGIKTFYLEYSTGDIDTLYVNYNKLSGEEAAKNPCYCYYPLEEVKFNGVSSVLDTSIKVQAVYLFEKH